MKFSREKFQPKKRAHINFTLSIIRWPLSFILRLCRLFIHLFLYMLFFLCVFPQNVCRLVLWLSMSCAQWKKHTVPTVSTNGQSYGVCMVFFSWFVCLLTYPIAAYWTIVTMKLNDLEHCIQNRRIAVELTNNCLFTTSYK